MNDNISSGSYRSVVLAGAVVALSSAVGCTPQRDAAHPARGRAPLVADRATCVDRYIKSIWKGHDVGGPECAGLVAQDDGAAAQDRVGQDDRAARADDRRRIQKVCERTQVRTILTGEAPTSFTLATCAARALQSEQPAIHRTCRAVSRAYGDNLNAVQLAACTPHLREELSLQTARSVGLEKLVTR